jgi:acyl carrier protein
VISDSSINEEIINVLAVLLRVRPAQIAANFSPAQCDTWDSVRHLMIMLAIEDKFGVIFDEKEIATLTSPAAIGTAVQAHLAKK